MRKVLLAAFGVVISLALTELILRVFWTPPFLDKRYQRNDLDWISKNVVLNRFGYRDSEYSMDKKDGVFRVYMLGDSYTYGWMLNDINDSYPKVLENLLKEKYKGRDVEVINASRAGFNFSDEITRLKQEGIAFSPDVVVVGVNIFDFISKSYSYSSDGTFPQNLRLYQATIGAAKRISVARQTDGEIKATYTKDSPQMVKARQEISSAAKMLEEIGSHLTIVVFPYYDPAFPNSGFKYPEYQEILSEIGRDEGVEVVTLSSYFDKIDDKTQLVLNPTDPHPTVLGNKLAAEVILSEINFDSFMQGSKVFLNKGRVRLTMGSTLPELKSILTIKGGPWVYFDRVYGDSVQKHTLPEGPGRRVNYLEDSLKTARLGRHEGWVGAKIEQNIPLEGSYEFIVPAEIYGFNIVGVSQFSVFWREKGALKSRDLELREIDITKQGNKLTAKITSNFKENLDLVKVVFDVSVKQFDLDGGKVVAFGKTKVVRELSDEEKIISQPKFTVNGQGTYYLWCNDKLASDCSSGSNKEIPVMVEEWPDSFELPTVEYLF